MGDGGNKKFVIELHSPYFLHPSEGPRVMITAVVFDGHNYDLWETVVRTTLKGKTKLSFILNDQRGWETKNSQNAMVGYG